MDQNQDLIVRGHIGHWEDTAWFAQSVLNAMKNGDIWKSRLEQRATSSFASCFTSAHLFNISALGIPYSHNGGNSSNYLFRFWRPLNELIYGKHLKQCSAHERTVCLLVNIILERWLNSLNSCPRHPY